MLLETVSVCALFLGAVIYYVPRKTWSIVGMTLLYEIKYGILGMTSVFDDMLNFMHNKIDLPSNLSNKIAIVTGGSRGIGAIVVKNLLQCDMEVIIACRTIAAGEKTLLQIRESGVTSGRAKVYKLDNSSQESVRKFTEQIKQDYDKIHILINNAGIMFGPYRETEDGFEEQWAVNYLSHFLLTSLLLPLLKAGGRPSDCSRIINITSCAHILGSINFNDINYKEGFISQAAYAQSKLAQAMFTVTLQKLLTEKSLNVHVYSVHPGIVKTELFKNTYLDKIKLLMIGFKRPDQGAVPIVYTAISNNLGEKGGLYISNCKEASVLPLALQPTIQKRLFELSLKQTNLDDFFQYL